jgi:BA14K-like protein
MSFVVYLAVLLVAAASALFGLDLLTAPLPPKPPAQVASTTASKPEKLSQRQAQKEQADKQANNRALNPVFPAHPGESKDARTVSPPANETTGANHADTAAVAAPAQAEPKRAEAKPAADTKPAAEAAVTPQQTQPPAPAQQASQPAPPQMAAATPDDRGEPQQRAAAAAAPAAAPVAQQAAGHCDIQTCTQAYSSFRASDCTYQPFSGPRRVCGKPGSAQRRTATTTYRPRAADARAQRDARPWDSRRNPELDDAVRRVQQMPYPGDDDDYDRPRSSRRVIVIERGGGGLWP